MATQVQVFPTATDLPILPLALADNVLMTMRNMVEQRMIDLYPPDATSSEWRAWLRDTRQWITLDEWQREVLDAVDGEEA